MHTQPTISPRACLQCGQQFTPTAKHPSVRFCSRQCSAQQMGKANRKPGRERPCARCGQPFTPQRQTNQFCSRSCSARSHAPRDTTPAPERFWALVDKSGECWLWTGGTNQKGYGCFHPTKGATILAPRYSWLLAHGEIPAGQCVLHNCPGGDNPRCVNPAHLFLGTRADNNADAVKKQRNAKGAGHGSAKLTAEQAQAVRDRYASGEKVTALAREFGVSHAAISLLVHGRTWNR